MWCDECGRAAAYTHGLANGRRFDVIHLCEAHRGELPRHRARFVRDAQRTQQRTYQTIAHTITLNSGAPKNER